MLCISFFALFLFSFLLFCAIFFSPASLPSPTVPDKTTDSHARLLTLNIFMRPPGVKNNWSDYKDDRLEYIMDYILPEYDIIAFQEAFAFASRRKDRLIRRARELGFNYHVESPRHYPWELAVDGGLLLISRFPIRQSDTIEFPRGTHSDWLAIKGALHALIELNPSRSLHVYTTHTQASYDLFNVINQGDTEIRLSQFARLHQFMSDTAGNDGFPVMVMGDLNVDAATHGEGIAITQPSKESSREYRMLMDVLRGTGIHGLTEKGDMSTAVFEHPWKLDLTDVIYDHYGYHPVTFGDYEMDDRGNLRPAETVLTDSDQLMTVQNIDRMLWAGRSTPVQIVDPKVEKFMVKDNLNMDEERRARTAFTQISGKFLTLTARRRGRNEILSFSRYVFQTWEVLIFFFFFFTRSLRFKLRHAIESIKSICKSHQRNQADYRSCYHYR
ncbi:Endonuclease/exonuclease/phosphatase [Radiomyces spectabilis]|uniref:Endonuclease/exonuclease/phosphatase n=1 Tax=Radiomyces spectabilis TaxID=64574 RepID=UPI00221E951D|nr:Endonuclease/exonuclease/phosphatase [Radiomyces spectabilis]KAI8379584.1 Endonuclease/exonuclease/phosphatase [Radiomyces spectabilis]